MDWKFARNVILKALVLLLLFDTLLASTHVSAGVGSLSLYNHLIPGRKRFPFGENPAQSYNISVYNIDALFASHEIAGTPKAEDEYRVLLIGDSSTWGTLLRPEETLAGQLEAAGISSPKGKQIKFYNLGYPTMTAVKDLLILQRAMQYQPDLILWPVTLESLVRQNQLNSPLVMNNLKQAAALSQAYSLNLNLPSPAQPGLFQGLLTKRRELADLIRLQMYGIMWAATGQDQYYPPVYTLAQRDFEEDNSYHTLSDPLTTSDLALEMLHAGVKMAGNVPVLFVNEPILVSSGENSHIRYNFYYPQWAYDEYREILAAEADQNDWLYLDLWDQVPESEFTNTAVHLSPFGVSQLAETLRGILPETIRTGRLPEFSLAQAPLDQEPLVEATAVLGQSIESPEVAKTEQPSVQPGENPGKPTPTAAGSELSTLAIPTDGVCLPPEQWRDMPVTPEFVSERMIEIYKTGLENGTNPNVFSVIGDCQNVPQVFLGVFDQPGEYDLGAEYAYLQQTIDNFAGSFNRKGMARKGGLNAAAVLSPFRADPKLCEKNETPLQCELRLNRPSIVLVSLEEWWSKKPMDIYEGYLRTVLDEVIASGAVPIMVTKADNLEGNHAINQTIAKLACEYQIPLWNYWRAVQPLPDHGLWADGFHLTVGFNDFDNPNEMDSGRPMRNLTGLQAIDRVWRAVNQ